MPDRRHFLFCLSLAGAASVYAAGGGGGGGASSDDVDPRYSAAVAAIMAADYARAITLLSDYIRSAPSDADAHNWLGFAYRKSGQLDAAFRHYELALRYAPFHRGAHEYIGEAYLIVDKPAKAEEHLKRLERLCPADCEEYRDLKQAIDAYRAGRKPDLASRS